MYFHSQSDPMQLDASILHEAAAYLTSTAQLVLRIMIGLTGCQIFGLLTYCNHSQRMPLSTNASRDQWRQLGATHFFFRTSWENLHHQRGMTNPAHGVLNISGTQCQTSTD